MLWPVKTDSRGFTKTRCTVFTCLLNPPVMTTTHAVYGEDYTGFGGQLRPTATVVMAFFQGYNHVERLYPVLTEK